MEYYREAICTFKHDLAEFEDVEVYMDAEDKKQFRTMMLQLERIQQLQTSLKNAEKESSLLDWKQLNDKFKPLYSTSKTLSDPISTKEIEAPQAFRKPITDATFIVNKEEDVYDDDDDTRVTCVPATIKPKTHVVLANNSTTEKYKAPNCGRNVDPKVSHLSIAEFNAIPAYMKGRINIDQINLLINKFNETLFAKYNILNDASNVASNNRILKDKRARYKLQECEETKKEKFCVDDDLKEIFSAKEMQLFNKSVVQIMRHFRRFKEVRSNGLRRYVINSNY